MSDASLEPFNLNLQFTEGPDGIQDRLGWSLARPGGQGPQIVLELLDLFLVHG